MRSFRLWFFVVSFALGMALISSACGSSFQAAASGAAGMAGDPGAAGEGEGGAAGHAAAGGRGGGAGSAAGGAPQGGTSALGNSRTESCILYVEAYCKRFDECRGSTSATCPDFSLKCPDLIFSPGSTRTIASATACAKAYETFACDQALADDLPACVTPGLLKSGAACLFNSQCASLSCSSVSNTCGTCDAAGHAGAVCSPSASSCATGLTCDATAHCAAASTSTCGLDLDCPSGQYCSAHACLKKLALGQACTAAATCVDGAYCDATAQVCQALPAQGKACGIPLGASYASECASGLACSTEAQVSGVCQRPPSAGSPCLLTSGAAPSPRAIACAVGAKCDGAVTPPACVALSPAGTTCARAADCAPGLHCACADSERNDPSCAKTCVALHFTGQPCGGRGVACHPGFGCVAGSCKPIDSQDLAAACGN